MSAVIPNGVVPKISLGWNGQLLDRHEIPIKMSNADTKAVKVFTLINPDYEVAKEIKETVKINGADIKVSFWVYSKLYNGNSPPQIVPAYVHAVENKPIPYVILGNDAETFGSRYEIPVLDAAGNQYKESRSGLGLNPDTWWQVYSLQPPTGLDAKHIMSSVKIGGEVKDVPIWMYYKLYDGARDKSVYKQQHWITNRRPDDCPKTCEEVPARKRQNRKRKTLRKRN